MVQTLSFKPNFPGGDLPRNAAGRPIGAIPVESPVVVEPVETPFTLADSAPVADINAPELDPRYLFI
jgi:hypothetical protein